MATNKLKILRTQHGETQRELAEALGVTDRAVSFYENGQRQIPNNLLLKIAVRYNVTVEEVLGVELINRFSFDSCEKDHANFKPRPQGFRIPVLGRIPAGVPFEAIEEVLDFEELPIKMKNSGEFYGLKVVGNSMSPGICDGDTIIVRKQSVVDNKEVAVVLVNGNDATVKEVQFNQFGITLVGWNVADFPPRFFTVDEVENLPVSIIGKVIEVRRKL